MNKIWLIIQREYTTRVKKKSFLLLTILGPMLMAGLFVFIAWLGMEETETQNIIVVDDQYPAFKTIKGDKNLNFEYGNFTLEEAKQMFTSSNYTAVLYLPENITYANTAILYFKKQPSLFSVKNIENSVEKIVEDLKLDLFKIDRKTFDKVNTNFHLNAVKFSESGNEKEIDLEKNAVGFVFGLFIYMFIFLYGVQVMRGVIEEKTNRIVEVIVCSVRPFQLMLGKIIGVAMVGFTQFIIWIILTLALYTIAFQVVMATQYGVDTIGPSSQISADLIGQMQNNPGFDSKMLLQQDNIINRINFPLMLSMFAFYFLGGYLLYSAMFAAIGSAVDSETDVQQFMLPVTLPLIAAYIISIFVIQNPDGPAAFWFSIIPFTSPIVMMTRLAVGIGDGGIPFWEVGLSMSLLIVTFFIIVWLASKIYNVGILMYGKKPSFKELLKWLKQAE